MSDLQGDPGNPAPSRTSSKELAIEDVWREDEDESGQCSYAVTSVFHGHNFRNATWSVSKESST